jgi:uncharacterized protein (TIGR02301 family)
MTDAMIRLISTLTALLLLTAAPVRAEEPVAPYDATLQRFSEILGALHHLRRICGFNDAQVWRNQMQALIDAETPKGERRARMVASFNRSYQLFQQNYHECTPAAELVIRRYLAEGSSIAREVTARYAN